MPIEVGIWRLDGKLCLRLLGRTASESDRLRQGDGSQERGDHLRMPFMSPIVLTRPGRCGHRDPAVQACEPSQAVQTHPPDGLSPRLIPPAGGLGPGRQAAVATILNPRGLSPIDWRK
jgi:hypothetical protein